MFIEEGSPTNSRFTRNFQMKHVDVCLSLCRQSKNCLTTIWNHHNSPRCKTLKILNYVLVDFLCPHLIWILWGNSCCNDMSSWFRTDVRTENYLKKTSKRLYMFLTKGNNIINESPSFPLSYLSHFKKNLLLTFGFLNSSVCPLFSSLCNSRKGSGELSSAVYMPLLVLAWLMRLPLLFLSLPLSK